MCVSLRRKESEGSVAGCAGGRVWRHQETGEGYRKPLWRDGSRLRVMKEADVRARDHLGPDDVAQGQRQGGTYERKEEPEDSG